MIITIDTAKDSNEEIQKAIAFLSSLLPQSPDKPKQEDSDIPPQTGDILSQFFDTPPSEQEKQPPPEEKKEGEYIELPKVIAYNW